MAERRRVDGVDLFLAKKHGAWCAILFAHIDSKQRDDGDWFCLGSDADVAAYLGCSTATVCRLRRVLLDEGLIETRTMKRAQPMPAVHYKSKRGAS